MRSDYYGKLRNFLLTCWEDWRYYFSKKLQKHVQFGFNMSFAVHRPINFKRIARMYVHCDGQVISSLSSHTITISPISWY